MEAKKDIRTIGRELGVRYVLEGSVRKAGSSLRMTAQLIDAASDAPLWSEKYSGTIEDIFEVQERVAREIVKALDITLTSDEHTRLKERPTLMCARLSCSCKPGRSGGGTPRSGPCP